MIYMDSRKIYACKDHVEDAMDDFINYEETFPIIEEVKGVKCNYCENDSCYIIKSKE
jgi:CxxH/CxxC protein (TIGR04129 family)